MTEQRWSDRVGTPRTCQLCARRAFAVKRALACWSDEAEPCMPMDRCSVDLDRCRALAELAGIRWPDGLMKPKPRQLPATAGSTEP